jgi:hypothetical protein
MSEESRYRIIRSGELERSSRGTMAFEGKSYGCLSSGVEWLKPHHFAERSVKVWT